MEDVLIRKFAEMQSKQHLAQEVHEEEYLPFCICGSPLLPKNLEDGFIWHPSNRF